MCLAIFSDPPSCFTVSTTETDFYRFIGRDNAFSVDSILAWCRQLLFAFCRLFFLGGGRRTRINSGDVAILRQQFSVRRKRRDDFWLRCSSQKRTRHTIKTQKMKKTKTMAETEETDKWMKEEKRRRRWSRRRGGGKRESRRSTVNHLFAPLPPPLFYSSSSSPSCPPPFSSRFKRRKKMDEQKVEKSVFCICFSLRRLNGLVRNEKKRYLVSLLNSRMPSLSRRGQEKKSDSDRKFLKKTGMRRGYNKFLPRSVSYMKTAESKIVLGSILGTATEIRRRFLAKKFSLQ